MTDIESNITLLKHESQTNTLELTASEKRITTEIEILNERLKLYDIPTQRSDPKPIILQTQDPYTTHLDSKNSFWDDINHNTFLRIKQTTNQDSFIKSCLEQIPGSTVSLILKHQEWNEKYLVLAQERKESIAKWKESRNLRVEEVEEIVSVKVEETIDRRVQKEMIEKWKLEKAIQRQKEIDEENAEKQNIIDLENKRREAQKKQKEQVELLQQIKQDKLKRERKLELENKRNIERQRSESAASVLAKCRERDQNHVEKMSELKKAKIREKAAKEERIVKMLASVQVNVDRDPERLLKPTLGYLGKLDKQRDDGKRYFSVTGARPRLAVPSWRAGL